jgi:hypothetical protein
LKNGHLRRFPHPSSLRRTLQYASVLGIEKFSLKCENFRNSGKGFICHFARSHRSKLRDARAIVFGGLHLAIFELPVLLPLLRSS